MNKNSGTLFDATTDPVESLKQTLSLNSRDWSTQEVDAWIWGIVIGWDDPEDSENEAMKEVAVRHRWSDAAVARLRALHASFLELSASE